MKTKIKHLTIIALSIFTLYACSNDDDVLALKAPTISNFEYGEGSSHSTEPVGYIGSDIHLEAEIYAEATISSISVEIHAHDLTPGDGEVEWDFEQIFTGNKYLVANPTFHEHIDIPDNIPAGEYHIVLTATDELGNSTEIEGYIQILAPMTLSDIAIDSSVIRGNDFHTEFMIYAVHGIHNITVDVHAHGITPGAGEVEWDYEEEFHEGYHGEMEVEFHEHIAVPATAPAGEYHIIFTIEDEIGNTTEHVTHIDVTAP